MNTPDLITLLAQSPLPKKPLSFSLMLFAFLAASIAFTLLILGLRPDLASAQLTALHKMILLSAVAWTAGFLLQYFAKPLPCYQRLRIYLWPLILLYLGSIIFEFSTTPLSQIIACFYTVNFPDCLLFVTLYGAIGCWLLVRLMRFYAPYDNKKAGAMIGFAAAATGAVGYSLHCPIDSPVFITIAYGVPILLISVIMRKLGDKFIRW
jgi:hypothetical protein